MDVRLGRSDLKIENKFLHRKPARREVTQRWTLALVAIDIADVFRPWPSLRKFFRDCFSKVRVKMANALLVRSATVFVAAPSTWVHDFGHFDVNRFICVSELSIVQSFSLSDQANRLHGAMRGKRSNRNRVE